MCPYLFPHGAGAVGAVSSMFYGKFMQSKTSMQLPNFVFIFAHFRDWRIAGFLLRTAFDHPILLIQDPSSHDLNEYPNKPHIAKNYRAESPTNIFVADSMGLHSS